MGTYERVPGHGGRGNNNAAAAVTREAGACGVKRGLGVRRVRIEYVQLGRHLRARERERGQRRAESEISKRAGRTWYGTGERLCTRGTSVSPFSR